MKINKINQNWPNLGNISQCSLCHIFAQTGPDTWLIWQIWLACGSKKQIWARIKINVAQIWASSALFGLFMADIGPSFGLLVAQIWQTGADRPSGIIPCGILARRKCQVWAWSGPQEFCYLGQMRKRRKSNPIRFFLWRTNVSEESLCKRDWHNVRSYLFFNVRKFRTHCAKTFICIAQIAYIHLYCSISKWYEDTSNGESSA